jgi:hypothetical protein
MRVGGTSTPLAPMRQVSTLAQFLELTGPAWTRDASEEFRRFRDLSRRILTVPKQEVDATRAERASDR